MANVVLCTAIFLLVAINLTGNSSAKVLGYGVLNPNHPCDPKHPETCNNRPPANGYSRDCEKEQRCRGPPRGKDRGREEFIGDPPIVLGQHRRPPSPPPHHDHDHHHRDHHNDHEAKNGVYNRKLPKPVFLAKSAKPVINH